MDFSSRQFFVVLYLMSYYYKNSKGQSVYCVPDCQEYEDEYAHYGRGKFIPAMPVKIVIIGNGESGKSVLAKKIIDGLIPALSIQLDYIMVFSTEVSKKGWFPNIRPYSEFSKEAFVNLKEIDKGGDKLGMAILDDPPTQPGKKFKEGCTALFSNLRHFGWGTILITQDVTLLKKDTLPFVKTNSHLFIFPAKDTPELIPGLKAHNILNSEMVEELCKERTKHMWNVLDYMNKEVHIMDLRPNSDLDSDEQSTCTYVVTKKRKYE